jgi:hypothetical protein
MSSGREKVVVRMSVGGRWRGLKQEVSRCQDDKVSRGMRRRNVLSAEYRVLREKQIRREAKTGQGSASCKKWRSGKVAEWQREMQRKEISDLKFQI